MGVKKDAKRAAKKAFQRQVLFRRTAYQDTMADMRDAGLNPILAYQQGATTGSGVALGQSPSQLQEITGAVGQVAQAGHQTQEARRAGSAKKLIEVQSNLNRQMTQTEVHKTENQRLQAVHTGLENQHSALKLQKSMAEAKIFGQANEFLTPTSAQEIGRVLRAAPSNLKWLGKQALRKLREIQTGRRTPTPIEIRRKSGRSLGRHAGKKR